MAVNTKIINRRIKSIVNTRKITKAMELVAASKMRKAVSSVLATRPYASLAWEMVGRLRDAKIAAGGESEETVHPLLAERPGVKKTLAVLITSDRGLCGGFNAQMLKVASEFLKKRGAGSVSFIAIGKRGESWLRRRGLPIAAAFPDLSEDPTAAEVSPLARLAKDRFLKGDCDEVVVLYTDFVSAIVQKARAKRLLPLRRDSALGEVAGHSAQGTGNLSPEPRALNPGEYLFEPDPVIVLDRLLPRILESQIYQALLESQASEHSARMLAMRGATDAASEMLDDLRFTFNQARQAGITQEIAEISSGAAAIAK